MTSTQRFSEERRSYVSRKKGGATCLFNPNNGVWGEVPSSFRGRGKMGGKIIRNTRGRFKAENLVFLLWPFYYSENSGFSHDSFLFHPSRVEKRNQPLMKRPPSLFYKYLKIIHRKPKKTRERQTERQRDRERENCERKRSIEKGKKALISRDTIQCKYVERPSHAGAFQVTLYFCPLGFAWAPRTGVHRVVGGETQKRLSPESDTPGPSSRSGLVLIYVYAQLCAQKYSLKTLNASAGRPTLTQS